MQTREDRAWLAGWRLAMALWTLLVMAGCGSSGSGGFFPLDADFDTLGVDLPIDPTAVDSTDGPDAVADIGAAGDVQTGSDVGSADADASDGADATETDSGCQNNAACDDGDACTNDSCSKGQCSNTPIVGCGAVGAPCDAANPCKTGICEPNVRQCVACLESADCGQGKACVAMACVAAIACKSDVDCKASNQVCNKADGICADCLQDGDCGAGNQCAQGTCKPMIGCASSKDCPAVCDLATSTCVDCVSNDDCPATAFCSADHTCQPDVCKQPACGSGGSFFLCAADGSGYANGVVCEDGNPCTQNTCDPNKGCVLTSLSSSCTDGDACTEKDVCSNNACIGAAVNCDDKNGCTKDSCQPALGCQHAPVSGPCDDGSACTQDDQCVSGSCKGGAPVVCDDQNPCTTDSCDPLDASDPCTFVPLANAAACADGNPCTENDVCSDGWCEGTPVDCEDGNPCTSNTCDASSGACNNADLPYYSPCDDGEPCSTSSACMFGFCMAVSELSCDDGNPCTKDSCGGGDCLYTPLAGSCADSDPCTTGDSCEAGTCKAGSGTLACNDANACTTDSCKSGVGCVFVSNTASCNDNDACTSGDQCKDAACQGVAVTCNDGDACTIDTCSALAGCTAKPDTTLCDDNNPCTIDTCAGPSGGCSHTPAAGCCLLSSECDDAKPCTTDYCVSNACAHIATPGCCGSDADCEDDAACTTNTCKDGSCVFTQSGWTPAPVLSVGWEDGLGDWTVVSSTSSSYAFDVSFAKPYSGDWSLRYGPTSGTMSAVKTSFTGVVLGPMLTIPTGKAELQLWVLADITTSSPSNVNRQITIGFLPEGTSKPLKLGTATSTGGNWKLAQVDLTPLAGQKGQLRLQADVGGTNTYPASGTGLYVDAVLLQPACTSTSCSSNSDCAKPDLPCAQGTCNPWGQCAYVYACCKSESDCDDGVSCTTDYCDTVSGQCGSTSAWCACLDSGDCDDGNACTLDTCTSLGDCTHQEIGGCCKANSDCFDGQACTVDLCGAGGSCTFPNSCCQKSADCNDGDDVCTTDSCVDGTCLYASTGAEGCCTPLVWSESFDGLGLSGWTLQNSVSTTQGWQLWSSAFTTQSAPGVLYYGSTTLGNFDFGSSTGAATSPSIAIPVATSVTATIWIYMDTETSASYDALTVRILRPGKPQINTLVKSQSGFAMKNWYKLSLDLTPYAGENLQLVWYFNTVDGAGNGGKGVLVDQVEVTRSCP